MGNLTPTTATGSKFRSNYVNAQFDLGESEMIFEPSKQFEGIQPAQIRKVLTNSGFDLVKMNQSARKENNRAFVIEEVYSTVAETAGEGKGLKINMTSVSRDPDKDELVSTVKYIGLINHTDYSRALDQSDIPYVVECANDEDQKIVRRLTADTFMSAM